MFISMKVDISKKDALAFVNKEINGQGGFQTLLKRIREGFNATTKILKIDRADAKKIVKYATSFGQGGFQDRLAPIVEACKRA